MKLSILGAAALVVMTLAGPASAQMIPLPPFVTNPALNPPPGVALRPVTAQEQKQAVREQRRATRKAAKQMRQQRANACHAKADEQALLGKARRVFVSRCRSGR